MSSSGPDQPLQLRRRLGPSHLALDARLRLLVQLGLQLGSLGRVLPGPGPAATAVAAGFAGGSAACCCCRRATAAAVSRRRAGTGGLGGFHRLKGFRGAVVVVAAVAGGAADGGPHDHHQQQEQQGARAQRQAPPALALAGRVVQARGPAAARVADAVGPPAVAGDVHCLSQEDWGLARLLLSLLPLLLLSAALVYLTAAAAAAAAAAATGAGGQDARSVAHQPAAQSIRLVAKGQRLSQRSGGGRAARSGLLTPGTGA